MRVYRERCYIKRNLVQESGKETRWMQIQSGHIGNDNERQQWQAGSRQAEASVSEDDALTAEAFGDSSRT